MSKEEKYEAAFDKLTEAFLRIYEVLSESEQRAFDFGEVFGTLNTLKDEIEGSDGDDGQEENI